MGKKILFIFHQKDFDGGASRSLIVIIENLLRENTYNIQCLLPGNGEISNYLEKIKIEYRIIKYYPSMTGKNKKWYIKKIIFSLINSLVKYRLLKTYEQIELVYTNTSIIDLGFELSKKLKCKHIYHVREFGEEDQRIYYLYSISKRKKLLRDRNTKIITISKSLKEKYEEITDRKDIDLIPNGIKDLFLRKEYKEQKVIKFIIIGTISFGKNQLEVLKALKILKDKEKNNFILEIIGSGKKTYIQELKNYIKINNLEKYVKFLGKKSEFEIKKLLNLADIGLMLSQKEAFGRVTVEYMLAGLPVIASNSGANLELIINEKNGYLYQLGNPKDLAIKMERLLENYELIERFGRSARKRALENYTADINYKNIKREIDEVLK